MSGMVQEAGADARRLMGVGAEAYDFSAHLAISQEDILIQSDDPASVPFIALCVYLQGLAFVDKVAENLVEYVAEVTI